MLTHWLVSRRGQRLGVAKAEVCSVQLKSVPELHSALDHVAATVPPDVAVDNHSINPVVIGVGVEILLHLEEMPMFWGFFGCG